MVSRMKENVYQVEEEISNKVLLVVMVVLSDGDSGVNYVVWFDVIMEGEERFGGRLEFGYKEKDFLNYDFFHKYEDICSSQSHNCIGRVMRVLMDKRNSQV